MTEDSGMQRLACWGVMLAVLTSACATTSPTMPGPKDLYVSPKSYDFDSNPQLLSRILKSPHGYFRFINQPFSEAVCRAVRTVLEQAPSVNLHGDAHLEQYAVTDLGRGLTDFDDAVIGPAPVDLLRFGVSLMLATRTRGWQAHDEILLSKFLAGYRDALQNPKTKAPEPAVAARIRKDFKADRSGYFEWVRSISGTMTDERQSALREALKPYVDNMLAESPNLKKGFFEVVDVRRLKLGIGSALDDKYLVRIQGPSSDAQDDLVLEVKEVRDLSGVSCISATPASDPFRILVGQSRIAYTPYRFLGYLRLDGKSFWIHAWVDNYRELKIGHSAQTPGELGEVAYDVGVQLGRGHPNQIAAPLDLQLRKALLTLLVKHEADFRRGVRSLAADVQDAWHRFAAEQSEAGGVRVPPRHAVQPGKRALQQGPSGS